jgi:voltage-gated potassium channel
MPALGLLAITRFFIRMGMMLWRKEEMRGLLWATFVVILSGTWFYHQFEPTITTWVDAYYFTVITLTSIGYGDFSPTTPLTKVFTTFYVFVGLGMIAALIGLVSTTVIEEANQKRAERNKTSDRDESKE